MLRGAKGFGWLDTYRKSPEEFQRFTIPTPFDWSKDNVQRPKAFFEVSSGGENWGRLVFELAHDVVPKTVENFKRLTTGDNANKLTYRNTKFHKIRKGEAVMGGDVEHKNGDLSHSSYETRFIQDENFIIPHSSRGLISMASVGVNTNGSQFYISLSPTYYMNGRCTVFGRLVEGEDVLSRLEKVYTYRLVPSNDIVISDCGVIEPAAQK
eukprot:gene10954-7792_t